MKRSKFVLGWITWILLVGCTANPKSDGSCTKRKGPCPIGGGKIRVKPLSNATTIKCASGATLPNETYRFLVYEDITPSNPSAKVDGMANFIPKGGIAYTPTVTGTMTVVTPQEDWCTDSCGVAVVEFSATCAEQSSYGGLYVPGMVFDGEDTDLPQTAYTVTVQ